MRHALLILIAAIPITSTHGADAVRIRDVRVGFVSGNDDYHKVGSWAPVVVEIENQIIGEEFEGFITVETADSDGVVSRFSPRRVFVGKQERQRAYVTYIKIGSNSEQIRVHLRGKVGKEEYSHRFTYPDDRGTRGRGAMDSGHKLLLALGDPKGLEPPTDEERWEQGRTWQTAFQNNVNLLPDKWFGYEGVDVVILPTGGPWANSMAQSLANDQLKRQALAQWVEMGGHLVVTVSMNHSFVGNPQSFPLEPILPARIDAAGTTKVDALALVADLVQQKAGNRPRARSGAVRPFGGEVARLQRRHPSQAVVTETNPTAPVIVLGSRGLGRITVVAFDTDQGPFAIWENRRDFWPALLDFKYVDPNQSNTNQMWMRGGGRFGWDGGSNDLAAQLCTHLEQFGEVKVIPFAWVALFIFVYILIVGPLDYIVLKKVVKRLEWTWITFPVVVLAVSVGAFFLAQYLKGNELRINKVDVVEMDTHTNQAYGTTWFTVFSPRLQHYTLGIEPVGFDKASEGTVVSWMGRPGYHPRGMGRSSGPGLFTRNYEFENDGQQLKGVPIQVWSMKTFTGRWQAPLDPGKTLITHDLKADRMLVEGTLTSRLPYTLKHPQLIYGRATWRLDTLEPNQPVKVRASDSLQLKELGPAWGSTITPMINARRYGPYGDTTLANASLAGLVRQMMYFDALKRHGDGQSLGTSEFVEYLDQSWRLEQPEAVLIGLLDDEDGSSLDLNAKGRPGTRLKPFEPALRGTMRQTTVVRIYLPVRAAE
jgi:hypothetical protein